MDSIDFKTNPLNRIIGLSVILSVGFLLVILAGIYGNWFPIVIGIIFAVAYLPVAITRRVTSFDPFSTPNTNVLAESAQFLSAFLLVSGLYLPIVLHHSFILTTTAATLTIIGGVLIFGTVYTFSHYFDEPADEDGLGDL
ncbi:hypothetical protein CANMA_000853 [Candida margitis]|uniref:uncharacterized protein n=1 Tax=Candida margitis TaxID=1775924 RepID=UPI0022261735|nr:uncharacterized protein CANMA_000853 [Candida margitis]KAI5970241.1 hypothetical protein CANMA_000853 [Candida margitis]